jgi:hypothetical protein
VTMPAAAVLRTVRRDRLMASSPFVQKTWMAGTTAGP